MTTNEIITETAKIAEITKLAVLNACTEQEIKSNKYLRDVFL